MKRKAWKSEERKMVLQLYATKPTEHIARLLGRTSSSVYQFAAKFGLHKSAEYLASPAACRLRRGDNLGAQYRFTPGQVPHNKGARRPGWAPGRMRSSQFKSGSKPHTWKAVGSTRVLEDGYLQRKVAEPKVWKMVHVLLWEENRGPVPSGHVVVFKDKDKSNIALENLELVSRSELMVRNSVHRLPKELAEIIQLRGALNRKIRSLDEKQNDRPAQPSL